MKQNLVTLKRSSPDTFAFIIKSLERAELGERTALQRDAVGAFLITVTRKMSLRIVRGTFSWTKTASWGGSK